MVKKIIVSAVALCALMGVQSDANAGLLGEFYSSFSYMNTMSDSNNVGIVGSELGEDGYGVAFGWELPIPLIDFRTEVEYNMMGDSADGLEYDSLMLNAFIDVPFPLPFIAPYVGVGAGEIMNADSASGSVDGDGLSYQYMAGLELNLPATPFYTAIEYKKTDMNFENNMNLEQDIVALKARYVF